MIVYNITSQVEETNATGWLQWAREVLIPAMMQTGCFVDFKIWRLLQPGLPETATFAIQYELTEICHLEDFQTKFQGDIEQLTSLKWGDRYVSFSSVLELI